jgi:hypothetical protein
VRIGRPSQRPMYSAKQSSEVGDPVLGLAIQTAHGLRTSADLSHGFTLADYDQEAPDSNYLCCTDSALVKFERQRNCRHTTLPDATYVPDPNYRDKLIPVWEVIGGDRVAERLGERVYKIGRTTGLTEGVLDLVGVQRQIILINAYECVHECARRYTRLAAPIPLVTGRQRTLVHKRRKSD